MATTWVRRAGAAKLLGLAVMVAPLVSAGLVCFAVGHLWVQQRWTGSLPVRLAVLALVGAAVGYSTAQVARRFLPLALLLQLTLAFPDHAPSRVRLALRANRAHRLRRMIIRGEAIPAETPQEVATTLLALVGWLTVHDRRTRGHSERVCAITALLADELEVPLDERNQLAWAALLHDVGKVAVPAALLNKGCSLNALERTIVERHTVIGHRLVADLAEWLGPYHLVPLEHHERFDGSGYPLGKSGAEISWGARIVAAADVLDVMTSTRSYRVAGTWDQARAELVRLRSQQFDPVVVGAALRCSLGRHRIANVAGGATGGGLAALLRTVPSALLSVPTGVVGVGVVGVVGATVSTAMVPVPSTPAELVPVAAEVAAVPQMPATPGETPRAKDPPGPAGTSTAPEPASAAPPAPPASVPPPSEPSSTSSSSTTLTTSTTSSSTTVVPDRIPSGSPPTSVDGASTVTTRTPLISVELPPASSSSVPIVGSLPPVVVTITIPPVVEVVPTTVTVAQPPPVVEVVAVASTVAATVTTVVDAAADAVTEVAKTASAVADPASSATTVAPVVSPVVTTPPAVSVSSPVAVRPVASPASGEPTWAVTMPPAMTSVVSPSRLRRRR